MSFAPPALSNLRPLPPCLDRGFSRIWGLRGLNPPPFTPCLNRNDGQSIQAFKVSAIIGEQREAIAYRSSTDQKVKVADEKAGGPQPASFLGKYPADVVI